MNPYPNIGWIDEYMKRIAPFIYVRKEDNLLIKIPNEAYKLNPQGIRILKHLLAGKSIFSIVDHYPEKERVAHDIHDFFCDLRAILKGCYDEHIQRRAVEQVPFSLPYNTLPVLSEIAITYRCNLVCRFCYASCGCHTNGHSGELTTRELKEILFIIRKEAEVPSVSFTGGEPTLRQDLPELVRFAKSLHMWTNLITNATLITKRLARRLKKAGLDSAQVSLEAGDPSLHDHIVRKEGAFSLTMGGLENLKDAGIRVHTNTTISRLNREHLRQLLEVIKRSGLDRFSMNMLMPQGSALDRIEEVLVTYTEIREIVMEVARRARELGLEFMWYSPTPICIFNPIAHGLGNKGCAACDGLLSIAPNGEILPCSSFPRPMGRILDMKGRFRQMWREPDFAFFQEKRFAHEICQACENLAFCNGGCPLYWRQVGFGEIYQNVKEAAG